MAPLTFHLIKVSDDNAFLASLLSLAKENRPLYTGSTKHWIHEPSISVHALTGTGPSPITWSYLLVLPSIGPTGLELPTPIAGVEDKWSITAPVPDDYITAYSKNHHPRQTSAPPPLPTGWSAADHSGLDASIPPTDLSASLALRSRPLGQPTPVVLKDFIPPFATAHPGPVAMFNLLAYIPPGGREKYMNYIAAFRSSIGIKYGGEPLFLGPDVMDWSSKLEEQGKGEDCWVDCALVWYPSLWHFGKMLDDPEYARVDREFKEGAIRDNPLICCVEVDVGYVD